MGHNVVQWSDNNTKYIGGVLIRFEKPKLRTVCTSAVYNNPCEEQVTVCIQEKNLSVINEVWCT